MSAGSAGRIWNSARAEWVGSEMLSSYKKVFEFDSGLRRPNGSVTIKAHMAEDESARPVTRAEFTEFEKRQDGRFADLENRLVETIRDSQTEVLRAFEG
jgi:hypothetical protein